MGVFGSRSSRFQTQSDKMKAAPLLIVVVGMASVDAGELRKRFLIKEIQNALNSVGDFFTKQYNSAKDAFNKAVSGISPSPSPSRTRGLISSVDFDKAVDALIPL